MLQRKGTQNAETTPQPTNNILVESTHLYRIVTSPDDRLRVFQEKRQQNGVLRWTRLDSIDLFRKSNRKKHALIPLTAMM